MFVQSLKMAWESIRSNKMRSLLTMLGIIIGVLALVVLVSIVNGATSSITDDISSMGNNMLSVTIIDNKGHPLSLDDLDMFKQEDEIKAISPTAQTMVTAKSAYNSETATVYGVTSAYENIAALTVEQGRFLRTPDVDNHSYAAVVSMNVVTDILSLSSAAKAIGEEVVLNGKAYQIIGVLEEETSSSGMFTSSSYDIYIPYTSLIRLADNIASISSFSVSSATDDTSAAENALGKLLLKRFDNDEEAFSILNMSSIMDVLDSVTGTLSLLLGGIAAISLLVGGIGIMNIMLVSVTERTREIGIRKAIGAGRKVIMTQFLIEALVLSLLGSAIGVVSSWGILKLISLISGDINAYNLSASIVIIAVCFSLALGVLFGIYPANKAAKKKPIDALRYDG